MYTTPSDGVTEIAGLATLEPFWTRGIATRLTALAVHRAMAQGAEVVCLTAADERAGRVYERVGFVGCATMPACLDSHQRSLILHREPFTLLTRLYYQTQGN